MRATRAASLLVFVAAPVLAAETEMFAFGAAGRVHVYAPPGLPQAVVLFVSGDGGWNLGVIPMAERLRDLGALVVGIDIRSLLKGLAASGGRCAYPAGDLEELSRAVQLRRKLPAYRPPILVGYSSGATLVYAVLVAAPPEAFTGAISLGFCPDLAIGKPFCRGRALVARPRGGKAGFDLDPDPSLTPPWYVLQGGIDQVCDPAATREFAARVPSAHLVPLPKVGHGFSVTRNWDAQYVEAYQALAASHAEAEASLPGLGVPDLPLVEVPAQGPPRDVFAVVLTGDGGWAEIDKGIATAFAARGIPVVGWNSLKYYWSPRTPEGAAADLDRLLRHALDGGARSRALLVGYSFGADVLPFLVNRLPAETRARVSGVALIGLGTEAAFEFHIASWLGAGGDRRYPTAPEVARLSGLRVACVQGEDEADSGCRALPPWVAVLTLVGGHHFGGDYEGLCARLLETLDGEPGAGRRR